MFKVNKKKAPERPQCRCSGVFIANFEHILQLILVFLLLTLNKEMLTERKEEKLETILTQKHSRLIITYS